MNQNKFRHRKNILNAISDKIPVNLIICDVFKGACDNHVTQKL